MGDGLVGGLGMSRFVNVILITAGSITYISNQQAEGRIISRANNVEKKLKQGINSYRNRKILSIQKYLGEIPRGSQSFSELLCSSFELNQSLKSQIVLSNRTG